MLKKDHLDFYENIQLQLQFRENTVKTAFDIRRARGDNSKQI